MAFKPPADQPEQPGTNATSGTVDDSFLKAGTSGHNKTGTVTGSGQDASFLGGASKEVPAEKPTDPPTAAPATAGPLTPLRPQSPTSPQILRIDEADELSALSGTGTRRTSWFKRNLGYLGFRTGQVFLSAAAGVITQSAIMSSNTDTTFHPMGKDISRADLGGAGAAFLVFITFNLLLLLLQNMSAGARSCLNLIPEQARHAGRSRPERAAIWAGAELLNQGFWFLMTFFVLAGFNSIITSEKNHKKVSLGHFKADLTLTFAVIILIALTSAAVTQHFANRISLFIADKIKACTSAQGEYLPLPDAERGQVGNAHPPTTPSKYGTTGLS